MIGGPEHDQWRGLHASARTVWGMAGAVPAGLAGLVGAVALTLAGAVAWAAVVVGLTAAAVALWGRLIGRRWRAW